VSHPPSSPAAAAILEPVECPVEGWTTARLVGLVVDLWPEEEPQFETSRPCLFLRVQFERPVIAALDDGSFDFDTARRFVLYEAGDGRFHGEVAGLHAVATRRAGGRWELTLFDTAGGLRGLSDEELRRRLHEEIGGDV
jgi:hypothetical protein